MNEWFVGSYNKRQHLLGVSKSCQMIHPYDNDQYHHHYHQTKVNDHV